MKLSLFLLFSLLIFPTASGAQVQDAPVEKSAETAAVETAKDTASNTNAAEAEMENVDENNPQAPDIPNDISNDISNDITSTDANADDASDGEDKQITVEWGEYTQVPDGANAMYLLTPPQTSDYADDYTISRAGKRAESHPATWKTNTEWLAVSAGLTTYGLGGTVSIATLRWSSVYWEMVKFSGGAWKRVQHTVASTMLGMPFWISERHEIRAGIGISAGYLRSKKNVDDSDESYADAGITASIAKSYLMLPLEANYIYHYKKHLAFFAGVTLAFPLVFETVFDSTRNVNAEDFEIRYRPFFGVNTGIRL